MGWPQGPRPFLCSFPGRLCVISQALTWLEEKLQLGGVELFLIHNPAPKTPLPLPLRSRGFSGKKYLPSHLGYSPCNA